MRINRSIVWSVAIGVVIVAWILSGQFRPPSAEPDATGRPSEAEALETPVTVRARQLTAEPRVSQLVLRGRTEAMRKVSVRAETDGRVVALPFERGALVSEGDVLCELAVNARDKALEEARALLAQRRLEFEASQELSERGVRSPVSQAGALAAYEAAQANYRRRELDLANTKIRAPFDGVFDDRRVNVGDYMRPGEVCGTVIDLDPFLVVGQVSERELAGLAVGDLGRARLVTGEELDGRVRFIAREADPATRTFRIELEVRGETLRDGVTAELTLPRKEVLAHRLTPAVLTLNDEGVVGVRIVDDTDHVQFLPVEIIDRDDSGVWITGLPRQVTVVTVGQDFVSAGQRVEVVMEEGAGS